MTIHALRGFAPKSTEEDSRFSRKWKAKDEELKAAYERIEELEGGLRGMIGLIQLLSHNREIPQSTRDDMMNNHRVIDAQEMLK